MQVQIEPARREVQLNRGRRSLQVGCVAIAHAGGFKSDGKVVNERPWLAKETPLALINRMVKLYITLRLVVWSTKD